VPALLAALVMATPTLALAAPDGGAADGGAADGGAIGGEGSVRLEGHERYRALAIDGKPSDELLKVDTFSLPAGDHSLQLTRSDGTTFETHVAVRAGETAVVARTECAEPLGGAPPPVEVRPRGCCGGGGGGESARGYGLLAGAALAVAVTRRGRRRRR